jgi:hypothetical protein
MIFGFFIHQQLSDDHLDEVVVLEKQPRSVRRRLLEDVCFAGMVNFAAFKPYKPGESRKSSPFSTWRCSHLSLSLTTPSSGFVKSICHTMQPYLALPAEIIIAKDGTADKVFLIVKGRVQVLEEVKDEGAEEPLYKVIHNCEDGSIVGDFKPSMYTFRAAEYTECYMLHIDSYIECFSYITQSSRGRKASKKNLADDFANVVKEATEVQHGTGFTIAKKERRQTAMNVAMGKLNGLKRKVEESSGRVRLSGRSTTDSGMDSEGKSPKNVSVMPILE